MRPSRLFVASSVLAVVGLGVLGACASAPLEARRPAATTADAAGSVDAGEPDDAGLDDAGLDDAGLDANGGDDAAAPEATGPCPRNMALVDGRFCVDKWEASLVEATAEGGEKPWPHYLPPDGHDVRAVSEPGVFPQGFVSELQADDACQASGKRLCTFDEWRTACMGPEKHTFPYGAARASQGTCHDAGKSPIASVFGAAAIAASSPPAPAGRAGAGASGRSAPAASGKKPGKTAAAPARKPTTKKGIAPQPARPGGRGTPPKSVHSAGKPPPKRGPARASARPAGVAESVWTKLNDPRLGQVEGALSRTGEHGSCVSAWGAFDMVGNLHEWVATDRSLPHGTFAGGYYLDTSQNGDGCLYRTVAHAHEYHDYSTGFRCCADPDTAAPQATR